MGRRSLVSDEELEAQRRPHDQEQPNEAVREDRTCPSRCEVKDVASELDGELIAGVHETLWIAELEILHQVGNDNEGVVIGEQNPSELPRPCKELTKGLHQIVEWI